MMKDLPHHIKKLNRRIVRSVRREKMEDETYDLLMPSPPVRKAPLQQMKKQAKIKMRQERMTRTPTPLSPEEREKKMEDRVPVFDRINNAKPRVAKPTKKKTPPI